MDEKKPLKIFFIDLLYLFGKFHMKMSFDTLLKVIKLLIESEVEM